MRDARVGGAEPIPLLSDLLEEFPDARINIDVKADGAIGPLRRDARATTRSTGSASGRSARAGSGPCARPSARGRDRRGRPGGRRLLRFAPALVAGWLRTPRTGAAAAHRHRVRRPPVIDLVTPALVDRAHDLGKHVHVWTVDEDATEMHRLLDLGADGIVTDHIDVLADVLAERGYRCAA